MATTEHIDALKAKHAELDRLIAEEESELRPDEARITKLKRQKLRIKDEILLVATATTLRRTLG
jgi:hypothetical protein